MSNGNIHLKVSCPDCGRSIPVLAKCTAMDSAPKLRQPGLKPVGNIFEYRITSNDIQDFLSNKVREYSKNPNANVKVVPIYRERKHRRKDSMGRGYASLRVVLSNEVINQKDFGWCGKIGDSGSPTLIEDVWKGIIKRYRFSPDGIKDMLSSYKKLEEAEMRFGLSEEDIKDIRRFTTPRSIPAKDPSKSYVVFAASCENVIEDMFEDPETSKVPGRFEIVDIRPITNDVIEFVIYLYPNQVEVKDDEYIRQIVCGDSKK